MEEKRKRGLTIRLGPLGLSLLAACITAVGVAAVSMADSGSGSGSAGNGKRLGDGSRRPAPGGGAGVMMFHGPNLSAADRQKMEDFRKCMEDNGAPAPPDPGKIDPSNPPKPPSAADREKIQKAYEACKDKLPTDMQNAGPPGIGTFNCGPPPGARRRQASSRARTRTRATTRAPARAARAPDQDSSEHNKRRRLPRRPIDPPSERAPRRGPFVVHVEAVGAPVIRPYATM